jgi:hypothetical protein
MVACWYFYLAENVREDAWRKLLYKLSAEICPDKSIQKGMWQFLFTNVFVYRRWWHGWMKFMWSECEGRTLKSKTTEIFQKFCLTCIAHYQKSAWHNLCQDFMCPSSMGKRHPFYIWVSSNSSSSSMVLKFIT